MEDKSYINEDLLRRALLRLEEIKRQTNDALRLDAQFLTALLHQLGWRGALNNHD